VIRQRMSTENLNLAREIARRIRSRGATREETVPVAEAPRELKQTSRDMYRGRMDTIIRLMEWEGDPEGEFRVLTTPGEVSAALTRNYDEMATVANMVTTVLAFFKRNDAVRCDHPGAYEAWKQIHAALREKQKQRYARNEPSDKQAENYVGFQEMTRVANDLQRDPETFKDLRQHLQWMLLVTLLTIKPKRSDLGNVLLVRDGPLSDADRAGMDAQKLNYLDIQGGLLVLNDFTKTSDTYERIVERIPQKLQSAVRKSLAAFPRNHLFVSTRTREPYRIPNSYAQFVRRTFQELFQGRSAGVTLIRHAYVNEKIDFNKMSLADREKVARAMGHSVGMQGLYKWVNVPGQKARRRRRTRKRKDA
jgi:hypothetical protein